MSLRGKEIDIILLDVGPQMHPFLDNVSKTLFNYALSKSLNKPSHEMAILLYGTDGTNNALNEEFAADGKDDEYQHISVLQELRTPNQHTLQQLQQLQPGTGTSDFVDAITVAMDLAIKAAQARTVQTIPKKMILISNFAQEAKGIDEEFQTQLVEGLKAHCIQLHIICLDAEGAAAKQAQAANLQLLSEIKTEAGDREIKYIKQAAELLGVFRTREVSYTCVKAELEIGKTMNLRVRVYKKCGFEKLPSLKTKVASGEQGLANIDISREYFLATAVAGDGADQAAAAAAGGDAPMEDAEPVPLTEQTRAFRYGKQYVPIAQVENMFYKPGKTMQLLGFVDLAPLLKDQRYLFLNDPQVLLPEQDEASQVAWSGLIQSMHERGKAAVVRFARIASSQISLCALLPQLGSATIPDHAIMVGLPFSEDIRTYPFPPMVPKEELKPSHAQAAAARDLVRAMDLVAATGGKELVKPEETSNPILQRFYRSLGKLSLAADQEFQGKEEELVGPANEDQLVQAVFETHWEQFGPGARDAEAAFKQAFQTQEVEAKHKKPVDEAAAGGGLFGEARAEALGADASSAVALSDEYPVEDFKAAVSAGRLEAGVAALGRRAHDLVDKSVKNRAYAKALSCCTAIRQACVEHAHATPFNDFLRGIKDKYQHSDAHSEFWQHVCQNNLTLISSTEVASSSATPAEATAFLRPPQAEAAKPVVVEDDVVDLGDLDDME